MVRHLVDAHFIVTDRVDVERCRVAIITGEPLSVQRHFGYIVDAKANGDTLDVTLIHTGPPSCNCKEKPRFEHD